MPKKASVKRNLEADAIPPTIGGRIRVARKAQGLTQVLLAQSVGVAETAVNAWENDQREPEGVRSWLALSHVLGVSIDYLMAGAVPVGVDDLIDGLEDLLATARRIRVGGGVQDASPEEEYTENKSA